MEQGKKIEQPGEVEEGCFKQGLNVSPAPQILIEQRGDGGGPEVPGIDQDMEKLPGPFSEIDARQVSEVEDAKKDDGNKKIKQGFR